jgi:hypothetical protein
VRALGLKVGTFVSDDVRFRPIAGTTKSAIVPPEVKARGTDVTFFDLASIGSFVSGVAVFASLG